MTEENADARAILDDARESPSDVDVGRVVGLLDESDGTSRALALRALAFVARKDPDRVVDHADRVRAALEDGYPVAEGDAALVCSELAAEHPDAIRPAIPRLVEMLDEVPPRKGYRAAWALVPLVDADPAAFAPVADRLVAVLADPPEVDAPRGEDLADLPADQRRERVETLSSHRDQIEQDLSRVHGVQEFAAHALVEVADADPEALLEHVEDLQAGLSADPAAVRAATADALATLARADPEAVAPATDALVDVLGADTQAVQAYAVRALGHLGAAEAEPTLRDLAASNVDPELAELAADTADFLAGEE